MIHHLFNLNTKITEIIIFCFHVGPAVIRSPEPILNDEWLSIVAERDMKEGSLIVNNGVAAKGMSPGIAKGLNLNTPFYIGGIDKHRVALSPFAEVQHGFDGCIAHVSLADLFLFKCFK